MRELVLREYETSPPVELSVVQRDSLAELVPSLLIQPASGYEGRYTLMPSSTAGGAQLDDLSVVIEPNIPVSRVLFLVSYRLDPKHWQDSDFSYDADTSLVEATILSFPRQLRRAFRRGLLQGYRGGKEFAWDRGIN